MSTTSTLGRLGVIRIVPVVTIEDADRAPDVAGALAAGGIGCAEITLRTPQGLEAIRKIASRSNIVVGAGTVLTVDQVDRCVDAGAQFLVHAGFDDEVVARAHLRRVAILPGVATATEIQRALRAGLDVVKFFPADRRSAVSKRSRRSPLRWLRCALYQAEESTHRTQLPTCGIRQSSVSVAAGWSLATQVLRGTTRPSSG